MIERALSERVASGGAVVGAKRRRWWLIARDGECRTELLTMSLGQQGLLPVFSFEEEAEMFLDLDGLAPDGWRIRESTDGELTSFLFGLRAQVGRVALDPLPEALACGADLDLVSLRRNDFLYRLFG